MAARAWADEAKALGYLDVAPGSSGEGAKCPLVYGGLGQHWGCRWAPSGCGVGSSAQGHRRWPGAGVEAPLHAVRRACWAQRRGHHDRPPEVRPFGGGHHQWPAMPAMGFAGQARRPREPSGVAVRHHRAVNHRWGQGRLAEVLRAGGRQEQRHDGTRRPGVRLGWCPPAVAGGIARDMDCHHAAQGQQSSGAAPAAHLYRQPCSR